MSSYLLVKSVTSTADIKQLKEFYYCDFEN